MDFFLIRFPLGLRLLDKNQDDLAINGGKAASRRDTTVSGLVRKGIDDGRHEQSNVRVQVSLTLSSVFSADTGRGMVVRQVSPVAAEHRLFFMKGPTDGESPPTLQMPRILFF